VKLHSVQCEASPVDWESSFTIVITVLQGSSFDRNKLYLLNLFLDKKKLILRLMFKICIIKRHILSDIRTFAKIVLKH
jgi:hypothetical protein